MSPSKRHAPESQDDVSNKSPQKKRTLKSDVEKMDNSLDQTSQASSVLCEFEENDLNSTKPGNTSKIKVERNQDEENPISYNDAEANGVNCKAPNNDAEEIDNKASLSILSALNDTAINEDSISKKKKKKHKELEVIEIEDVSEYVTEDVLEENGENAEENTTEAKKKKKKKKKKKHRTEKQSDDAAEIEEIDTAMPFDDTKRMFEDLQKRLMEDKHVALSRLWDEFRFPPYSSKSCKAAFDRIMSKVQKKRTLLELLNAGGKMMEETPSVFCEKNFKNLKPVTPFKLFSQNHYKKLSEKHPEYRGIDVLNKLTKKWGKLSDEKRLKYIDLALAKKPEYMEDVKHYQRIDSSFVPKPILSKIEWQVKDRCAGLPDMPARNGYILFAQNSSELYPDMSPKDRYQKLIADFKMLPAEVKEKYTSQAKEEKKKYASLLENYLATLSPSDLEDRNLATLKKTKSKGPHEKPVSNFLSNKPPMSGYMLFFRELKEELKGTPIIKRHVIVSEKWKALSEKERADYNKRRLLQHDEWLKGLKSKDCEPELGNMIIEEASSSTDV